MKRITLPVAALLCSLALVLTATNSKAAVPGLAQQIPASEYSALADLYTTTQGPETWQRWTHSDGWTDPETPTWFGVAVSGFEYDSATGEVLKVGHVTGIALAHNNLIAGGMYPGFGDIPESLGNLIYLTTLDLSGNPIFGGIPDSLWSLAKLQRLNLAGDWLGGDIPENLGNLVNLQYLDLAGNDGFTGSIPESIGNLVNLTELNLYQNRLDGSIPETLGKLVNLRQLNLSYNRDLGGSIPASLGNLVNLQRLDLSINKFNGSIPESLVNLVNLQALDLGYNRFSGRIPEGLADLASLSFFDLPLNCFDVIPGSQARTIVDRMIAAGKSVFYSPQNGDCAPPEPGLAQQIPASEYAALIDLYTSQQSPFLWTYSNGWNDPVAPTWYGVTVSGLQHNPETGEILTVGHVTGLNLSNNNLIERIPASLGNLLYLQELDLSSNNLEGSVPESLGNLLQLRILNLQKSQLDSIIPASFGNLVNLQVLNLSENSFNQNIPITLGNLGNLIELDLSANQLSGSIPESLGNLANLQRLQLGGDAFPANQQLSGSIPASFTQLVNLEILGLERLSLSGNIPDLSVLPSLQNMGIQYNCFNISPGSQVRTIADKMIAAGNTVVYDPQKAGCGLLGKLDLNNDGCVDLSDLAALMTAIRARSSDLTYDFNGDGKVDVADARFLVLHFSNRDGAPCATPANAKIVEHLPSQTSSHNLK